MKKYFKKFTSLLLVLTLTLCLAAPALATGSGDSGADTNNDPTEATGNGSITIDNAVVGQIYKIYRILDLVSSSTNGTYVYTANSTWTKFINLSSSEEYVTVSNGYVTWKNEQNKDAAEFASHAQEYAEDSRNNIDPLESISAQSTTITFTSLPLGYYLVTSSLGTLCSLDTTNPSVTIKEKNLAPINTKTVKEDSTKIFGDTSDADIGQLVYFKSTIEAGVGAQNYVFHDTMSAGLTFNKENYNEENNSGGLRVVKIVGDPANPQETPVNAEEQDGGTEKANYTVVTQKDALTDGCTFEIKFTPSFCDSLQGNEKIVIYYSATLNENAIVDRKNDATNTNTSWLSYGEDGTETVKSIVEVDTWSFEVYKYALDADDESDADDEPNKINLQGAKFVLYKQENNKEQYAKINDTTKEVSWLEGTEGSPYPDECEIFASDGNGKITISGLDSDTYYLKEIAAPAGYNPLGGPVTIVIGNNGTITANGEAVQNRQVEIENMKGDLLPSTGGTGTTLFYIVGGILAVGAAVLLVTKRRMGNDDE